MSFKAWREMRKKCGVVLISGFLGSGKTTLLRGLIDSLWPALKPVVLINEFGKVGLDGARVRREELEIVEINRGSIFCSCAKGDFLRALYRIAREFKPGLLIVEASGVADTSDMENDLKNGKLSDFFQLAENLCVVDACRFEDFAGLFNAPLKQLKVASTIVINKVDLVGLGELSRVREIIKRLCPEKQVIETSFGRLDARVMLHNWIAREPVTFSHGMPNEREWEVFIEKKLQDPDSSLNPPDRLLSQSIRWEGESDSFLNLLKELPDDIVRAKGYFQDRDGRNLRFDYIRGQAVRVATAEGFERDLKVNLGVFIREKLDGIGIAELFFRYGLTVVENQI
jgi:G3E family GTPase